MSKTNNKGYDLNQTERQVLWEMYCAEYTRIDDNLWGTMAELTAIRTLRDKGLAEKIAILHAHSLTAEGIREGAKCRPLTGAALGLAARRG